jgi:hypothetical protein
MQTNSRYKNYKRPRLMQKYINAYTVEPGYNDIGLYDTSPIQSDILCGMN